MFNGLKLPSPTFDAVGNNEPGMKVVEGAELSATKPARPRRKRRKTSEEYVDPPPIPKHGQVSVII